MLFSIVPLGVLLVMVIEVCWASLYLRREHIFLVFIYKALMQELPMYLSSLIQFGRINYQTGSQGWTTLGAPSVSIDLGKADEVFLLPLCGTTSIAL